MDKLDQPKTAAMLAPEIDTHRTTAGAVLRRLEKEGLVRCLNPDDYIHKFYERTQQGSKAIEKARKLRNS